MENLPAWLLPITPQCLGNKTLLCSRPFDKCDLLHLWKGLLLYRIESSLELDIRITETTYYSITEHFSDKGVTGGNKDTVLFPFHKSLNLGQAL